MNYFFITGSSKGLGESLAEILLTDTHNFVYGMARSCSIQHQNYQHINLDLSDLAAVKTYQFPSLTGADKIILINNAGVIGDSKHLGNIDVEQIIRTYHVNLVAPAILVNTFIRNYTSLKNEKLIVNISSGAGRANIDGWSIYCSSKSGIDRLSEVLNEEIGLKAANFNVLSIAPGIIDTDMQTTIRTSEKNDFSNLERFIEYKENGDLSSPANTANQILQLINNPNLAKNVLCSVRDLTLSN